MELAFEEFEETLTDYSGALEEAFEVIDDLNRTAVVIQDEDQSDVNARLLEVSVESYLKRVGLNSTKYKKQMALESFASSAASNVKKAAILVWEKIKAALTALYKKVTDFFKFLFNKNKETEKKINETEKELEENIKEFKKAADAAKKEQGGKVKENPPEYSFNDNSGVKKLGYSSGIQQTPNYVAPIPAKKHEKGSHAYLDDVHAMNLDLSDMVIQHLYLKPGDKTYGDYITLFFNDESEIIYSDLEKAYKKFSAIYIVDPQLDISKMFNDTYSFKIGGANISVDAKSLTSKLTYADVTRSDVNEVPISINDAKVLLKQMDKFYNQTKSKREKLGKTLNEAIQRLNTDLTETIKRKRDLLERDADYYKIKEAREDQEGISKAIRQYTLFLNIFLNVEKYYSNLTHASLQLIKRSRDIYFVENSFLLRNYGYISNIDEFYKSL